MGFSPTRDVWPTEMSHQTWLSRRHGSGVPKYPSGLRIASLIMLELLFWTYFKLLLDVATIYIDFARFCICLPSYILEIPSWTIDLNFNKKLNDVVPLTGQVNIVCSEEPESPPTSEYTDTDSYGSSLPGSLFEWHPRCHSGCRAEQGAIVLHCT